MRVVISSVLLLGLLFPCGATAAQPGGHGAGGPAGHPAVPGGYGLGGPWGSYAAPQIAPGQYQEWLKRGSQAIKDPLSVTEAEERGVPVEEFSPCWQARQTWSNAPCPAADRLCTNSSRCPR